MRGVFLCLLALGIVMNVQAEEVKLKCWIVFDDPNENKWTAGSVSNHIDGVNQIYSQWRVSFR